jgi:hypothetical protein
VISSGGAQVLAVLGELAAAQCFDTGSVPENWTTTGSW